MEKELAYNKSAVEISLKQSALELRRPFTEALPNNP